MAAKKKAREPHPAEELATLRATLKQGLPTAVVLKGAEAYYRTAGARLVLAAATKRGDEVCRHDGKDPEFTAARLLDDLSGGSLFASARTIHLERADGLLKKGSHDFVPSLGDAIAKRLASSVAGCVVIGAETLRVDHAVVKATVKAGGVVVGCRKLWDSPPPWDPDPRRSELVQWLLGQARERKVTLGPDDAVYLCSAIGNDLAALLDRLNQIRDRGGEGLQQLVAWEAGASPWELAELLVDGDARRAVSQVEALFQGGFQGKDGTRMVDHAALVSLVTMAITGKVREAAAGAAAMATG
ncbi:MAG: hypothetical protein O2816_09030, partial [Planctomycetota bacterium]|nr:hypothetical protein [Planctomycetota bacterium]